MRVLVDAREAYRNVTGIGRVVKNFCVHLSRLNDGAEYLFLPPNYLSEPAQKQRKTRLRRLKNLLDLLWWRQVKIPAVAHEWRADVIFCADSVPPFGTSLPVTVIIFDLLFFEFRQYDPFRGMYYRRLVPWSIKKASRIITISQASKQAIIAKSGVPEKKVTVAYPGVADVFFKMPRAEALANIQKKYGLSSQFVLFVGSLDNSRRNLDTLLSAFATLLPDVAPKLVIVGLFGYGHEAILRRIEDLNLQDRVIFTGFAPDEELRWFYNAADLFVYPSLGEGFGMTVLEAMACGCPVICSDRTSLPEVVGDAGVLLSNPTDPEELAAHMAKILSAPNLRADLARRSRERAQTFSWERSARKIQAVLEDCVTN